MNVKMFKNSPLRSKTIQIFKGLNKIQILKGKKLKKI